MTYFERKPTCTSSTRNSESLEVPLPDKTLFFFATADPIKAETGKVVSVLTHASDIADLKQIHEELEQERLLLSTIIDAVPDERILKDLQSRFILVNKATVEAMGAQSKEAMLWKSHFDYVHHEWAAGLLAHEKTLIDSAKPFINQEHARRDPNTKEITKCILTSKVPVQGPDGRSQCRRSSTNNGRARLR